MTAGQEQITEAAELPVVKPGDGSALGSRPTRLVRNRNGGVHLNGCPYSGKTAVPWVWAEGRDDSEWKSLPWLHACDYCFKKMTHVRAAAEALRDAALTQATLSPPKSASEGG